MIDLLGHLTFMLAVVGTFLIGRRYRIGWAFRCTADVSFLVLGCLLGLSSMIVWGFAFLGTDLFGWRRWKSRDTLSGNSN